LGSLSDALNIGGLAVSSMGVPLGYLQNVAIPSILGGTLSSTTPLSAIPVPISSVNVNN